MKKKYLLITALSCSVLAATVLAGCGGPSDVYSQLNDLVADTPASVQLDVTVTVDGETLTGAYSVKTEDDGYRVTYSYEKLNTFELVDGAYVVPEEYKSTLTGNMLVSGGKIVEQNGAAVDITMEQITAAGVRFDESYFTDVEANEGSFTATVSEPSEFLQTTITCTGMTVNATYTSEQIESLTIAYTSAGGAQVLIEYGFGE